MPSIYETKAKEIAGMLELKLHCVKFFRFIEDRSQEVYVISDPDIMRIFGNIRRTKTNAWRSAYSELKQYIEGKKSTMFLEKDKHIDYPLPNIINPSFILPSESSLHAIGEHFNGDPATLQEMINT